MLKLTEVVTEGGVYEPDLGKCVATYTLRNVYVNPNFIVSMTDNLKFNEIHSREPVVPGLIPEAKFTKLMLAGGQNAPRSYDILGTPEQHFHDISRRRSVK